MKFLVFVLVLAVALFGFAGPASAQHYHGGNGHYGYHHYNTVLVEPGVLGVPYGSTYGWAAQVYPLNVLTSAPYGAYAYPYGQQFGYGYTPALGVPQVQQSYGVQAAIPAVTVDPTPTPVPVVPTPVPGVVPVTPGVVPVGCSVVYNNGAFFGRFANGSLFNLSNGQLSAAHAAFAALSPAQRTQLGADRSAVRAAVGQLRTDVKAGNAASITADKAAVKGAVQQLRTDRAADGLPARHR